MEDLDQADGVSVGAPEKVTRAPAQLRRSKVQRAIEVAYALGKRGGAEVFSAADQKAAVKSVVEGVFSATRNAECCYRQWCIINGRLKEDGFQIVRIATPG